VNDGHLINRINSGEKSIRIERTITMMRSDKQHTPRLESNEYQTEVHVQLLAELPNGAGRIPNPATCPNYRDLH
jgi:hypothetical protein